MSAIDLIVVVPADDLSGMVEAGFKPGRTNGHTITVSKHFADPAQAQKVASLLPKGWVWGFERCAGGN